jgi:hypothetical protein
MTGLVCYRFGNALYKKLRKALCRGTRDEKVKPLPTHSDETDMVEPLLSVVADAGPVIAVNGPPAPPSPKASIRGMRRTHSFG